jgi:hypothetical protein
MSKNPPESAVSAIAPRTTGIDMLDQADASSPLGILRDCLAQLPDALYRIVRFDAGDTYKKTERIATVLHELYDEVEHAREHTYHLMAAVVRQRGVNYDEPIVVCYLKPVFKDRALANWMIKTSDAADGESTHLVLNKQTVSRELADFAGTDADALDMAAVDEAQAVTGMKPGAINFLLSQAHYHRSFVVSLFQAEMIHMRPGETEYLGGKIEHNLDTAILEVPLGEAGMHHSVILDGSTFFWIVTEIQRAYPQIKFLRHDSLSPGALRQELAQIAESLIEGLNGFKYDDQIPLLNYFNNLEKYLEHYIRAHHPTLQSDTIAVFVKEFIRNFLVVEGKMLYQMVDLVIQEDREDEEKLRDLLYLFYRKFIDTEFAKNITPASFDLFLQKICLELSDLGIVNPFIVNRLLQDQRGRDQLAKRLTKKANLNEVLRRDGERAGRTVLELLAAAPPGRGRGPYQKYDFSDETVKSDKYFALHSQIVDLLPQFIARSAHKHSHPLLVFQAIQNDMIRFFEQRSAALGIGKATIANISRIFIRICFGKQIQLLDIIEEKLFLCGASVRNKLGMAGGLAPELARTSHQEQYAALRERRRRYLGYLLKRLKGGEGEPTDGAAPDRPTGSLLLPDLENFLSLPMMRDLFGSREILYARLTDVADFNNA